MTAPVTEDSMLYHVGPRALRSPTAIWLLLLVVLFATEYGIMLLLPTIVSADPAPVAEALIDAVAITAVLAPIIWWTLVRPLREVIRLRTHFLGDLFTAIEAERRQTAHELHDGVGQQLGLLVSRLRSVHESSPHPEEAARCGEFYQLAQAALVEVKRVALGLRPSLLDDLGLAPALDKVVRDCRQQTTLDITLDASALEGKRLPATLETAVFRIVQEALANILKHAGARHAAIAVTHQDPWLTLAINDDGCGFDPREIMRSTIHGSHLGLSGMRERIALLGGRFALDATPGRGCRLTITLPCDGKLHE